MPNRFKALLIFGVLVATCLSMAAVWGLIPRAAAVALIAVLLGAVALVVVLRGLARRDGQPKNSTRVLVGLGGALLVGAIFAGLHAAQNGWEVGDSIGSVVFATLFTGVVLQYLKMRKQGK